MSGLTLAIENHLRLLRSGAWIQIGFGQIVFEITLQVYL